VSRTTKQAIWKATSSYHQSTRPLKDGLSASASHRTGKISGESHRMSRRRAVTSHRISRREPVTSHRKSRRKRGTRALSQTPTETVTAWYQCGTIAQRRPLIYSKDVKRCTQVVAGRHSRATTTPDLSRKSQNVTQETGHKSQNITQKNQSQVTKSHRMSRRKPVTSHRISRKEPVTRHGKSRRRPGTKVLSQNFNGGSHSMVPGRHNCATTIPDLYPGCQTMYSSRSRAAQSRNDDPDLSRKS
jgi:hypothetical protein